MRRRDCLVALCLAGIASQTMSSSIALGQIIVDSQLPIAGRDVLAVTPAYAFRKLPADVIVASRQGGEWLLNSDVLLNLAKHDPKVSYDARLKIGDDQSVDTSLKLAAIRAAADRYSSGLRLTSGAAVAAQPEIVTYESSHSSSTESVDTEAIHNILEYVSLNRVVTITGSTLGLVLDPQFGALLHDVYADVNRDGNRNFDVLGPTSLAKTMEKAASDKRVASAVLVAVGNAVFGKPLVYPAKEKKLVVEPTISQQYDVYWVEFAFSPGEEFANRNSELFFSVTINDPSSIALQLIPLRYGNTNKSTTSLQSPEISAEAEGNKVSLGKVYEQTVEYSYLRPTILATGLQDSSFGWILKDDMVDASSKRLIAILGITKGTKAITITLAVSGHMRNWIPFQASVSSTTPVDYNLHLVN